MSADLRLFEYALEPMRQQRHWQVEAIKARLGRVQSELEEAAQELEALRSGYEEQSRRVVEQLAKSIDPGGHARALRWLADRVESIRAAKAHHADLHAARVRVAAELAAEQRKLDAVERHREECLAEFAQQEQRRLSTEADRDWLLRPRSAGAQSSPGDLESEP